MKTITIAYFSVKPYSDVIRYRYKEKNYLTAHDVDRNFQHTEIKLEKNRAILIREM